jgi:hypothetical protein
MQAKSGRRYLDKGLLLVSASRCCVPVIIRENPAYRSVRYLILLSSNR